MRAFRSLMTVLAFSLMGGGVLTGTWPYGHYSSRSRFLGEWVDEMIVRVGPEPIGWGLIVFGFAFAWLWLAVGHDR